MSIQRMRRRFAAQLKIVLWIITVAFVIGLPLVFIPGRMGRDGRLEPELRDREADTLAEVNGKPVTRVELDRLMNQLVGQIAPIYASIGQSLGPEQLWRLRYDALEQAITNRLLLEAAREQGIVVSRGELREQAQQTVDQEVAHLKAHYGEADLERLFTQIVTETDRREPRRRMTERRFKGWALDRHLRDDSGLREQMVIEKLRQTLVGQVSPSEEDLLASFDRATARRILVALRAPGAPERTEEEAKERTEALLARIRAGEDFAALARAESDDPEAAQTGGLTEGIGRGGMPETWEAAVFALKPGEVSEPIAVPWGYEIVQLMGIERELPEDFEENKQQYLSAFIERRRGEVWQAFAGELQAKATVTVTDPEMLAYEALLQGDADTALARLEEAKADARMGGGLWGAAVFYQLATLLAERGQWQAAADAYAEAADALGSREAQFAAAGRAQALLGLGRAYERLGQVEEAMMWYIAASDASDLPSDHQRLLDTFRRLGRDDLVAREQEWLANYEQLQRERQAAFEAQQKALTEQALPEALSPDAGP